MSARVIVDRISLLQETYFPSPGVCIEVVSPSILLRVGCLHLPVGHGGSCDSRWVNECSNDKKEVEKYMIFSSSRGRVPDPLLEVGTWHPGVASSWWTLCTDHPLFHHLKYQSHFEADSSFTAISVYSVSTTCIVV